MTMTLFDLEEPPETGGRDPLDRYYTPEWATQALVDYLGSRFKGMIWDPCCGKDWGGRVMRAGKHVEGYYGTDIDPDATCGYGRPGTEALELFAERFGFMDWHLAEHVDWIATNPPYRAGDLVASDFVRHALRYCGDTSVAMLLRLTWLEPCGDRVDILTDDPPTDVLILPRVNFIGAPGSNPCTSVWVIWDRCKKQPTRTAWHRRQS